MGFIASDSSSTVNVALTDIKYSILGIDADWGTKTYRGQRADGSAQRGGAARSREAQRAAGKRSAQRGSAEYTKVSPAKRGLAFADPSLTTPGSLRRWAVVTVWTCPVGIRRSSTR